MTKTRSVKLVHVGSFAAEVDVELLHDETTWSPYLSLNETSKRDRVRSALKRGDIKGAAQLARVFSLTPIAV
jgi:hypothetical protein